MDPTGAFWGTRKRETAKTANADAVGLTSPTR
jgi:hypothetical protein